MGLININQLEIFVHALFFFQRSLNNGVLELSGNKPKSDPVFSLKPAQVRLLSYVVILTSQSAQRRRASDVSSAADEGNHVERRACRLFGLFPVNTPTKARRCDADAVDAELSRLGYTSDLKLLPVRGLRKEVQNAELIKLHANSAKKQPSVILTHTDLDSCIQICCFYDRQIKLSWHAFFRCRGRFMNLSVYQACSSLHDGEEV